MLIPTLKSDHQGVALILGGRSWVGFCLTRELVKSGWAVISTTSRDTVDLAQFFSENSCFVRVDKDQELAVLIGAVRPTVVVNLLIGIDETSFALHQAAAGAAEEISALYVYSSSAMALDGYEMEQVLVEDLPPRSNSEYGRFKATCELDLKQRTGLQSLILRFASIHGWTPWKDSRTVSLLKRLQLGETVSVDQGIVQNRMSDKFLAETIVSLIRRQSLGVAHIGTADSSEEIDFLKRLAVAFGYSNRNIVPGRIKLVNLNVVPGLGAHPSGSKTESDTIIDLCDRTELAGYNQKRLGRVL